MVTKSFENDSDTNHGLNSHRKTEDASFMREAIRLSQLCRRTLEMSLFGSGSGKKLEEICNLRMKNSDFITRT